MAPAPVDATVALPGSKSMTNRALVLAALSDGESLLRRPLVSRDTSLMAAGLRALGARVDDEGTDWRVRPFPVGTGSATRESRASIHVGNAGTVMRFLPPVAALADGSVSGESSTETRAAAAASPSVTAPRGVPADGRGEATVPPADPYFTVTFDGDGRARERPLAPLLDGLRTLGADIDDGRRGALPLTIRARGRLTGGRVTVDASSSSQLVSGLLLAAPRYDKGVEIRHEGPPVPSQPHVEMTVAMLRAAGADVDTSSPNVWRVAPRALRAGDCHIEPDLSNAAPFLAAALVTGGRVRVPGWPSRTTQPGSVLRDVLAGMGATTALDPGGLTVRGTGRVHGIDADLHDAGELAPTIAAIAALAESPSQLRGIAHLRRHETDRLDALARELNALGGDVRQSDDGLDIRPRPLHGGVFHTYDDHRLATAAAVLGLVVADIHVENVATTGKTLPGFTELWARMLGDDAGGER